jgi:carbonic anhydrase
MCAANLEPVLPPSVIDEVLVNCERWARDFAWGHLPAEPNRELVVVSCMDSRQPLKHMLGLEPGDAHFIRNAGGLVTEDVLRSLLISIHLKGTREIMIIQHTECGLLDLRESEFRSRLEREYGMHSQGPAHFGGFSSLEGSVREQVARVRSHRWFPHHVPVRGFIYDVSNGKMSEVR